MPAREDVLPEVYSVPEIALAAGVAAEDVRRWVAAHHVRELNGRFYATPDAVRIVRHLLTAVEATSRREDLFVQRRDARRRRGMPIAAATAAHLALLAGVVLMSTAARSLSRADVTSPTKTQLVFLAAPGAGGGGGGGGHKVMTRTSAAERRGTSRLRSPLPVTPARTRSAPAPVVHAARTTPPSVVAPVMPADTDPRDTAGEPVDMPPQAESRGTGMNGEAGIGTTGGIGAGNGPGLGNGNGGGTGGGPYRPGAGINPPSLVREVKPDYTDEGRRRSVEGDVDLEIVVRRDGTVGDVKLLSGLGAGLDQRAIDAVRQWRFSPATREGAPVDVVVQVSVEFRLR